MYYLLFQETALQELEKRSIPNCGPGEGTRNAVIAVED